MKTEHVHLIVSVFHLSVGADVNMPASQLGSLNRGSVDKITRLLRRYSKSPERGSDPKKWEKQHRGQGLRRLTGFTGGCI